MSFHKQRQSMLPDGPPSGALSLTNARSLESSQMGDCQVSSEVSHSEGGVNFKNLSEEDKREHLNRVFKQLEGTTGRKSEYEPASFKRQSTG